jgi:hypothetical protein
MLLNSIELYFNHCCSSIVFSTGRRMSSIQWRSGHLPQSIDSGSGELSILTAFSSDVLSRSVSIQSDCWRTSSGSSNPAILAQSVVPSSYPAYRTLSISVLQRSFIVFSGDNTSLSHLVNCRLRNFLSDFDIWCRLHSFRFQ